MSATCSYIAVLSTAVGVKMIQEECEKSLPEYSAQHHLFLLKFIYLFYQKRNRISVFPTWNDCILLPWASDKKLKKRI